MDDITRAACPAVRRPFHYTATRSEPAAGILTGDILVLEHGDAKRAGDLVLVSLLGENGEGLNELRRQIPPNLASLDLTSALPVIDQRREPVGVIGRVAAVFRLPDLKAASTS